MVSQSTTSCVGFLRHYAQQLAESRTTAKTVETLMGRKPELRFAYIQENAEFVDNIDV